MPAPVAGIHVQGSRDTATWMAGSSPAMTALVSGHPHANRHCEARSNDAIQQRLDRRAPDAARDDGQAAAGGPQASFETRALRAPQDEVGFGVESSS